MLRIFIPAGAILLAAAGVANAQDAETTTVLDRLLVTDGLTPVAQEKSGRAFTVITAEDIERSQVTSVADILRTVPGLSVSRMGSIGAQTQVRVRGAEANHVIVMIDGVYVSDTAAGEFDFGSLITSDIERIEVLRGPQSAFYGSNALSGVINVITKRGERGGFRTNVRSETGTDGTVLGGVTLSGGRDDFDLSLGATFRRSDGYNVSPFGSEKDGDRNATLNGRFAYDLMRGLTLDGTLRYVNRRSELDPQNFETLGPPDFLPGPFVGLVVDGDEETATEELVGSLGLTHESADGAWTQNLRISGNDTFRENFTDGALATSSDGNRVTASYQATYAFDTPNLLDATHKITGGYEFERETYLPSHLTERQSRDGNSFVAEYRGEYLGQFFLNGAIRHDLNDRFADSTTFSLSGAWAVPGTLTRLHSSIGTGVTNPTFIEQFGYDPESFVGNPNLVPEESIGFDIGIEQGFLSGALIVDLTYFNQDLTNEIATVFGPAPTYASTPINLLGESRRQGIEIAATLDLGSGLSAQGSYTYLDASEQSQSGGPRLAEVRRPRHSGSLGLTYRFMEERASLFGEVIFNGETEDVAFVPTLPSRVTLDAYQTVNVGGSYRFNETFEAYGRVENLFDEDYQEIFGYNAQGRTAFVGLRGTF